MNTVIACPNCQKKMRVPANKRIYFNCVSCGTLIHLNNGVITATREQIELNPKASNTGRQRASSRSGFQQTNTRTRSSSWSAVPKPAKWIIAAAAVVMIGLFAYKISQVEHRYYEDIVATKDENKIARYLRGYPNGIYKAEVTLLKDSLEFIQVLQEQQQSCNLYSCNCSGLEELTQKNLSYNPQLISAAYEDCLMRNADYQNSFKALNNYRMAFPQGRYLDTINAIGHQLWTQLHQQYTQRINTQRVAPKAKRFFRQLLDFGQASGQPAIRVNFGYELALKDWDDYPTESHQLLDMMAAFNETEAFSKYPKPSDAPPPSIRNYFKSSNDDLQQIIVNALQSRLDSVFVPNPFQLERMGENGNNTGQAPTILIDYKIETLADDMAELSVPTLYVQQRSVGFENASNESEQELRRLIARSKKGEDVTAALQALQQKIMAEEMENNPNGLFQGYLLATSIDWDMQFKIPDIATDFAFKTVSQPNSSFSNIQSNEDAYQRMMESTFVNYAVQLAEGFGI